MAVKDAISELYLIMRDSGARERDRLNSAISASRVERLAMPGEQPPEAITWLRKMVDDLSAPTGLRREAASALAYWERRAAKMALTYEVPDQAERVASWRKLVNGALRGHLAQSGRWPRDKAALLTAADDLDVTGLPDPDLVLSALFSGGNRHERRARRAKAIDERVAGSFSGTEPERLALIRPLADIVEARLKAFGLGQSMEHQLPHHQTAAETLVP